MRQLVRELLTNVTVIQVDRKRAWQARTLELRAPLTEQAHGSHDQRRLRTLEAWHFAEAQ